MTHSVCLPGSECHVTEQELRKDPGAGKKPELVSPSCRAVCGDSMLENISDAPFLLGLVNSTHPFGFGLSVIPEGKPLLGFLKLSYFHKIYTRVYLMVVVIVQSLSHV